MIDTSSQTEKIKVLVVDDHTILREGIRVLLEAQPDIEVVAEASNGREAVDRVRALSPDVVLMDIGMPSMNGLEATRQIRKYNPDTQVVVLTMHDNEEYIFQILNAGAAGYVLKRAAAKDLVSAIRSVYQGGSFLHPTIAKKLIRDYLRRVGEDSDKLICDGLTDREREILKLIAEGNTSQQIADVLCLSVKTVQTHRTHIMDKLDIHDRTELVKYAIRKGLVGIDE
ncbi:MAG: response regulator transcription factor [Dehalococcoidales bacterium]|nr:response regulator transcription factor [Dehalococcoidales bacterium]